MTDDTSLRPFLIKGVLILTALAAAFLAAPIVAGYGIAFGGYIPYGVVCKKKDDLFAGTIKVENYITFLMNRGCDFDDAARQVAEANQLKINGRVLDMLHDRSVDSTTDEILSADTIRGIMRTFKLPSQSDDCPPGIYCPTKHWFSDDIITNFFGYVIGSYITYASPVLSNSMVSGATFLIAIGASGPVFSGILFLVYALLVVVAGAIIAKLFSAFVSGTSSK